MNILMVCTGNICRSPTAEGLLRHRLQAAGLGGRVNVDSAGTHGYHIGNPPDPRTVREAARYGVDLSGLRARAVASRDFQDFDLLLAMDQEHRRLLLRRAPQEARAKVRLYLDFAPGAGLREVPDPYYGGPEGFTQVFQLCELATAGLISHIQAAITRS